MAIAGFTIAGAALLLYLASPHQKIFARDLPRKSLVGAGIVLLGVSLVLLMRRFGNATAVFNLLTLLMLLWTLLPLAVAYWRNSKESRR